MPNGRLSITLTAVASGLAIAACGSSGNSTDSPAKSATAAYRAALAFSRCMRAHGLTNFPDPSPGGGIQLRITPNSGINPFSPTFKAAQASCHKLLPGGGPFSGRPTAHDKAQMLQISQCMRRHGITDFPDPTTSPPSDPANSGAVIGRNGEFLVLPKTIDVQSPAFKQAAAACKFQGPR
ncbi:MAG TPA: hypothetical protein VFI54_07200 [Solirubrobacteraceae bacterium]|nr:hypothetical protein [Solirubrobacteraceae bacterium]